MLFAEVTLSLLRLQEKQLTSSLNTEDRLWKLRVFALVWVRKYMHCKFQNRPEKDDLEVQNEMCEKIGVDCMT